MFHVLISKSESLQSVQTSVEGEVHSKPVLGQSRHTGGGALVQGRTKDWGVFGNVSLHSGHVCCVYSPFSADMGSWTQNPGNTNLIICKQNPISVHRVVCLVLVSQCATFIMLILSKHLLSLTLQQWPEWKMYAGVCRYFVYLVNVIVCTCYFYDCMCAYNCLCAMYVRFYVCMTACVYVKALVCVCTGVKLTCPGSLSIRDSCSHTPWSQGEDTWSSCLQWTHAAASPSLTSVLRHSKSLMNDRTSWTTMSVPILLYIFDLYCPVASLPGEVSVFYRIN